MRYAKKPARKKPARKKTARKKAASGGSGSSGSGSSTRKRLAKYRASGGDAGKVIRGMRRGR